MASADQIINKAEKSDQTKNTNKDDDNKTKVSEFKVEPHVLDAVQPKEFGWTGNVQKGDTKSKQKPDVPEHEKYKPAESKRTFTVKPTTVQSDEEKYKSIAENGKQAGIKQDAKAYAEAGKRLEAKPRDIEMNEAIKLYRKQHTPAQIRKAMDKDFEDSISALSPQQQKIARWRRQDAGKIAQDVHDELVDEEGNDIEEEGLEGSGITKKYLLWISLLKKKKAEGRATDEDLKELDTFQKRVTDFWNRPVYHSALDRLHNATPDIERTDDTKTGDVNSALIAQINKLAKEVKNGNTLSESDQKLYDDFMAKPEKYIGHDSSLKKAKDALDKSEREYLSAEMQKRRQQYTKRKLKEENDEFFGEPDPNNPPLLNTMIKGGNLSAKKARNLKAIIDGTDDLGMTPAAVQKIHDLYDELSEIPFEDRTTGMQRFLDACNGKINVTEKRQAYEKDLSNWYNEAELPQVERLDNKTYFIKGNRHNLFLMEETDPVSGQRYARVRVADKKYASPEAEKAAFDKIRAAGKQRKAEAREALKQEGLSEEEFNRLKDIAGETYSAADLFKDKYTPNMVAKALMNSPMKKGDSLVDYISRAQDIPFSVDYTDAQLASNKKYNTKRSMNNDMMALITNRWIGRKLWETDKDGKRVEAPWVKEECARLKQHDPEHRDYTAADMANIIRGTMNYIGDNNSQLFAIRGSDGLIDYADAIPREEQAMSDYELNRRLGMASAKQEAYNEDGSLKKGWEEAEDGTLIKHLPEDTTVGGVNMRGGTGVRKVRKSGPDKGKEYTVLSQTGVGNVDWTAARNDPTILKMEEAAAEADVFGLGDEDFDAFANATAEIIYGKDGVNDKRLARIKEHYLDLAGRSEKANKRAENAAKRLISKNQTRLAPGVIDAVQRGF